MGSGVGVYELTPHFVRIVYGIATDGNDVYVGGPFTTVGDEKPAPRIARWNKTTPVAVLNPDFDTLILDQNYPNPFNPSTTIRFTLSATVQVNLSIFDMKGAAIATLVNEVRPEGLHEVNWDGKDSKGNLVASGVYFFRLEAGKQVLAKKMLLLK